MYELNLISETLGVIAAIVHMRNVYRSRQHKPLIIPEPCLREPPRDETKTYGNDSQHPSSYETTSDKRIIIGIRHLERMQQIVINHSLQSQLTTAMSSKPRTRKLGWRRFCLALIATSKALQSRLRHTLHTGGMHMYSQLSDSGQWHRLPRLPMVQTTSLETLTSPIWSYLSDQSRDWFKSYTTGLSIR